MAGENHAVIASVVLLACWSAPPAAAAQTLTADTIRTLPAVLDQAVAKEMAERHVVGSAVGVVHDGRLIYLRGFGEPTLGSVQPVDPSRTLFRIGSVTKLLTAIAVMQQVDAGKLDLKRDVREYVPELVLPHGATTHQLLTHTAGLDERFAGASTNDPAFLVPLADHLRAFPPAQVIVPGRALSYSNYHYAVAGLVVERVSGLKYEQYMTDRVFAPLGMTATTAIQPPPDATGQRARGYLWTGGRQEPLPFRYTYAGPAGGVSATAADMTRVLLALLGDGSVDGARLLSPESVKALTATQYTPDPRIPGIGYGIGHWASRGQRLLFGDGTLGDQIGVVVLAPADRFGMFLAANALPGIEPVLDPVMNHLFGPIVPTPPPAAPRDAPQNAARVAGTYRDFHHTRNDLSRLISLMPMIQSRVAAGSDGTIRWRGRRWIEVEPLVFRSADSPDYVVFRENDRGEIAELHAWGTSAERIGWVDQAAFHLGIVAGCLVAFVGYPLFQFLGARRRAGERTAVTPAGRLARVCAMIVATANLAFLVWLVVSLRGLGESVPLPLPVVLWLSVPLVTAGMTALLLAFAAAAWLKGWWTRTERVGFSMFVMLSVAFLMFLNHWKLLGIRY